MRILIHIDGHLYTSPRGWQSIRQAIVRAARCGGGFVALAGPTGAAEVFISQATSVYAEFVEDAPERPTPEDPVPDFDVDSL
jgi:hypothetical protein